MTGMLAVLTPRMGALAARIDTEFHEMPGMRLTEAQARRLWGPACQDALTYLCEAARLARDPAGCYLLSSDMLARAAPIGEP